MTYATTKIVHDPAAAYEAGRSAAMFDGFDTSEFLECKCRDCLTAYDKGWNDGAEELKGLAQK
jgi:hypothetical protein